jgi:hypothetical protein
MKLAHPPLSSIGRNVRTVISFVDDQTSTQWPPYKGYRGETDREVRRVPGRRRVVQIGVSDAETAGQIEQVGRGNNGSTVGLIDGERRWDIDADSCSRPAGDPVPLHWDRRGLADDWEKRSRRIKANPATAPPAQHLVTDGWDYRQQIEVGSKEFALFEVELRFELKVKLESRSQSPAPTTFEHQRC